MGGFIHLWRGLSSPCICHQQDNISEASRDNADEYDYWLNGVPPIAVNLWQTTETTAGGYGCASVALSLWICPDHQYCGLRAVFAESWAAYDVLAKQAPNGRPFEKLFRFWMYKIQTTAQHHGGFDGTPSVYKLIRPSAMICLALPQIHKRNIAIPAPSASVCSPLSSGRGCTRTVFNLFTMGCNAVGIDD